MSILINYLSVLFLKLKAIIARLLSIFLYFILILIYSFTVINSVVTLVRVLNDNQSELLVGRNHNFVLQATNTDESNGLFLVNLSLGFTAPRGDPMPPFDGKGFFC